MYLVSIASNSEPNSKFNKIRFNKNKLKLGVNIEKNERIEMKV